MVRGAVKYLEHHYKTLVIAIDVHSTYSVMQALCMLLQGLIDLI